MIIAGGIVFDPDTRILRIDGEDREHKLTSQPARFLEILMRAAGRVVTADTVMGLLYPHSPRGGELLGVMVFRIRFALARIGASRDLVRTVRGSGWYFDAPDVRISLLLSDVQLSALRALVAQAPPHVRHAADMIRTALP